MLKVLHVVNNLEIGGAERLLADVVRLSKPPRFEHHLAYGGGGSLEEIFRREGGKLHRLAEGPIEFKGPGNWLLPLCIRALVRREGIGLVHAHLFPGALWGGLGARAARVPSLFQVVNYLEHVGAGERAFWRWPLRVGYRRLFDRYLCMTEASVRELVEVRRVPRARCDFLPVPVDLERFRPSPPEGASLAASGVPDGVPVVGTVGRLSREKSPENLLEIAPSLLATFPRARVVFVGEGPVRAELEARASALGVGDRIVFAGRQMDVRPWLARMDVFVFPMPVQTGGWGGSAVLEAMAVGKPVVAFAQEGLIEDGVNGRSVANGDLAGLGRAVAVLLADPEGRRRMGARARATVETRHGLDAYVRGLESLYEAMVRS